MGLQVSHGVHSEVGGIQCGGIHQGEECNLDCPELSGTETPFDREEFLSARLFRFHGGDGQTIRAGIHLAAGAGGAAFGGAEHGVGASAAFRRLLTGPFEGLTEISPRLCRGSFNFPEASRVTTAASTSSDSGHRIGSISSCLLLQIHPSSLGPIRFFPDFCRHPSPIYSRQAPSSPWQKSVGARRK